MKVVVLQSNYIPWKGYFHLINDADLFIFYDEVKYTKNDWRNRNKILTSNGMQWLTIPIPKESVNMKISQVRIKDPSWQRLHYTSISQGYRKASFYPDLFPVLQEFYLDKEWEFLSDLNQSLIIKISRLCGIDTEFRNSAEFDLSCGKVDRLLQLLIDVKATEYISGPGGKSYLMPYEPLFEKNNIKVIYKEYPIYPQYKQMSVPFRHDVSILDLVANIGFEKMNKFIWNLNHD